jgi:uncharacterized protein
MTHSNTPGAPCWIDLMTPDRDAAEKFYGSLFGWTMEAPHEEFGGYANFLRDGRPVAGCMPNDGSFGAANGWSVYLEVEDARATTEKARQHGAQVVSEPMDIADLGTQVILVDPAGALVGLWQPGKHQGFAARAEDGAPAWFETLSKDYEKSVAFYREVLGWNTYSGDTDEFRYTTLGEGEAALAGIMDAADLLGDQPSRWQLYVQVADPDATVAQAESLGGGVTRPAEDTPYGRLAVLTDPAGLEFNVIGPNKG